MPMARQENKEKMSILHIFIIVGIRFKLENTT